MTIETIERLERCASWHTKSAEACRTRAEQYEHLDETGRAVDQLKRREVHLCYADAIRIAVKSLKARERAKKSFEKPSLQEVVGYAKASCIGWPVKDIEQWYNHFESVGWVVGVGKSMKNWHAAAKNGFRRWQEKSGKAVVQPVTQTTDPARWKQFLALNNKPYEPYSGAMNFKKEAFREWLQSNG